MGKEVVEKNGYRSRFSHMDETLTPGYYNVMLSTPGVRAELTACDTHSGIHRYTFVKQSASDTGNYVLVDMNHALAAGAVIGANVTIEIDAASQTTRIFGWALNHGALTQRNGRGVDVFVAAEFNNTAAEFGSWGSDFQPQAGRSSLNGSVAGAYVKFDEEVQSIEMRVAISYVSVAQAQRNLDVGAAGHTFDTCQDAVRSDWRGLLGTVEIQMGKEDDLVMFYTALYHAFQPPTTWTEADGVYLGMDGIPHVAPKGTVRYTDLSIWDIHRTQIPLLALMQPRVAENVAGSLVGMYREGGDIPRWPIANVYSGCMIGTHGNIIISDLVSKNLTGFDIPTAYDGIRQQATNATRPHIGRSDLTDYIQLG
jgi:predicted alpha-1,2-mannosidase